MLLYTSVGFKVNVLGLEEHKLGNKNNKMYKYIDFSSNNNNTP